MSDQKTPQDEKNDKQERIFFPTKQGKRPLGLKIAISAVMISLNAIVTVLFAVNLTVSTGFFNVGESMVYLSAILFGPYIGAISGGLGGMIADLFLGYAAFAPATLIIKGIEGLIVGFLYQKLTQIQLSNRLEKKSAISWLIVTISGLFVSCIILAIGIIIFIGEADFLQVFADIYLLNINFTYIFWIIIASLSLISILLIYRFVDPKISLKIIAMVIGGVEIIMGYFIFEAFIPYIGFAGALSEIPFNIMQVTLGIALAVPISEPIRKTLKL